MCGHLLFGGTGALQIVLTDMGICAGAEAAPQECTDTEPGRYCAQGSKEMAGSMCPQGFWCEVSVHF